MMNAQIFLPPKQACRNRDPGNSDVGDTGEQ
jgi:hypothetical protein